MVEVTGTGRMGLMLYRLVCAVFAVIFRGIFRTTIRGRDRIPLTGPVLVVSNHISFADPPLLGIAVPRHVEFMTMAEMFRQPLLGKLVRAVGCIPVDRSKVDHTAAREAIRRLRAGRCLGIFPEAGIRSGPDSVLGGNPILRPGLETIAMLSQASIVPVIIRDSRKPYQWRNWLRRESMSVTFGYPFCLWKPPGTRQREDFQELVRTELLKTVALT